MNERPDIFISYARLDREAALELRDVLESAGLSCWFDEAGIDSFDSIQERIREGLAASKALVAYYSARYPSRPYCMAELTAALIAAEQGPKAQTRVFIVNPMPDVDHVFPATLRDRLLGSATPESLPNTAAEISRRLQNIDTSLGDVGIASLPEWHPVPRFSSSRFVGRVRELWQIHDALVSPDLPLTGEPLSRGICQVVGMGGLGKSLLVEEYAWRFAAAWPRGVFWLDAAGDRARGSGPVLSQEVELQQALTRLVQSLGRNPTSVGDGQDPHVMDSADLRTEIGNAVGDGPALWIVDDLPEGIGTEGLRAWLPPGAGFRTIITSRSHAYSGIGYRLHLDVLNPSEAIELLSQTEETNPKEPWPAEMAKCLGYHALALDVARSALIALRGLKSPQDFLGEMRAPGDDVLELAAELADSLPNGHEANIASTLLQGLERLGDDETLILLITSIGAEAPLPMEWLRLVFLELFAEEEPPLEARLLKAVVNLARQSLVRRDDKGAVSVHSLISRSVSYRFQLEPQIQDIRAACRRSLVELMGVASDARAHDQVQPLLAHARHLADVEDEWTLSLLSSIGDYELGMCRWSDACDVLFEASQLARELGRDNHLQLGSILARFGIAAVYLDRHKEALDAHREYERIASATGSLADVYTAKGNQAHVLANMSETASAIELEEAVLDWRLENLGTDASRTLVSMHQLAIYLYQENPTNPRICELEREAWNRRIALLGEDHLHTLSSLQFLAQAEMQQGNVVSARELADENLRLRISSLGEDHPSTLSALRVALATGSVNFAERELGLDRIWREACRQEASAIDRSNMVLCFWRMGEFDKAFELADTIEDESNPVTVVTARHNRFALLVDAGRGQAAEAEFPLLHDMEVSVLGADHPNTLSSWFFWAVNADNLRGAALTVSRLVEAESKAASVLGAEHIFSIRCTRERALRQALAADEPPLRVEELDTLVRVGSGAVSPEDAALLLAALGIARWSTGDLDKANHDLAEAEQVLSSIWREYHPERIRLEWFRCRLDRENNGTEWAARLDNLGQILRKGGTSGRIRSLVSNEIGRSEWARHVLESG